MEDEEILNHGIDFAPDMGTDEEASGAVFESLMRDLHELESNNQFTESELLILSSLESITSTVDFHKLTKSTVATEDVTSLFNRLTQHRNRDPDDNNERIDLDTIFLKMIKLPPLKTEVNFL